MDKTYNGIKYHSDYDISSASSLRESEAIICSFDEAADYNVNQVIEFYNIIRLLSIGIYPQEWDEKKYESYKAISKRFNAVIGKFYASVCNESLQTILQDVDILYIDDFWLLMDKYKAIERIDADSFSSILNDDTIYYVLKQKGIVKQFGAPIAAYMELHPQTAEWIIQFYRTENKEELSLPQELSKDKYESLIAAYIDSDNCSHTNVALMINAKNFGDYPVPSKLCLRAKKRYQEIIDAHKESMISVGYNIRLSFQEMKDGQISKFDHTEDVFSFAYDSNWLKDYLDYPTIFNNFRYVFDQIDKCGRSNLVYVPTRSSPLETIFIHRGINEFSSNSTSTFMAILTRIQVYAYDSLLAQYDIRLEDGFKWFFEEYLPNELNINGFHYSASSKGATWLEKCKTLASEMDRALKQYNMYVEDGEIDQELFLMSSKPVKGFSHASLIKNKYAYAASDEITAEMNLLFSSQSMLGFTERTGSKYSTFFDIVTHDNLMLEDYVEYQKQRIEWLVKQGSVFISEKGKITINSRRVTILHDLYSNGVVCPFHCSNELKKLIEDLHSEGKLEYSSTLFSRLEQDLLNYELNQSEFCNSLDLRNRYLHGNYPTDEKQHQNDYYEFLKLMILVIWKINEELCYVEDMKVETEVNEPRATTIPQ